MDLALIFKTARDLAFATIATRELTRINLSSHRLPGRRTMMLRVCVFAGHRASWWRESFERLCGFIGLDQGARLLKEFCATSLVDHLVDFASFMRIIQQCNLRQ